MSNPASRNETAVNFPFRPIFILMVAMGAVSLAGAGAAMTSSGPAPIVTTAR